MYMYMHTSLSFQNCYFWIEFSYIGIFMHMMNAFWNNLFTKKLSVENQMSLIAKYEPVLTFWQWHSQQRP